MSDIDELSIKGSESKHRSGKAEINEAESDGQTIGEWHYERNNENVFKASHAKPSLEG